MIKFIITEEFEALSGDKLDDYRIKQALSVRLGSVPFNRGFGSSLHTQLGKQENSLIISSLVFSAWDNPSNHLNDLDLIKVSVNENRINICYAKQGNRRNIEYSL